MTSSDYDPFAGFDDNREIHHRINQTLAEAGVRVTMSEDWAPVDLMAKQMVDVAFAQLGGFDRNPLAQRLAAELVCHTRLSWSNGHIPIKTHLFGEYNESNPIQLFALTWPSFAQIALRNAGDWKSVAAETMRDKVGCQARVSESCSTTMTKAFAVKRGEYICVFGCCLECFQHIANAQVLASDDTGPTEHWMAAPPKSLEDNDEDDYWS